MLKALRKHLRKTSKKQLQKEWAEVEALGFEGPTVEEYFQSIGYCT